MDRVAGGRRDQLTALALAVLSLGITAAPAAAQTAGSYSIVELQGVPQRLNDSGQIAGWVYVGADAHAAIYSNGVWSDLGVAPGDQLSALFGLSNAGAAVGYSFAALPGPDNRWQAIVAPAGASAVQALSVIAPDSFAYGINDGGAVVGCLNRYDDIYPDPHRAFLYAGGSLIDLHALLSPPPTQTPFDFTCARAVNTSGAVVGEVQLASAPQRGFLYRNGAVTLLQQNANTYLSNARAVSDAGKVVGDGRLASFVADHALVYDVATGAISSLGLEATGAFTSRANDVNDQGDVVGMMFLTVGEHAFLASGGQVHDLNDLLPAGSEWVLQEAFSINDDGDVVGRGYLSSAPTVTRYFLMQMQADDPVASIDDLIAQVRALHAAGFLSKGNATALIAMLKVADRFDDFDCTRRSVQALEMFVRHVDMLIRTGRLSPGKGQPLIVEANRIIDAALATRSSIAATGRTTTGTRSTAATGRQPAGSSVSGVPPGSSVGGDAERRFLMPLRTRFLVFRFPGSQGPAAAGRRAPSPRGSCAPSRTRRPAPGA
jgi:probable HAF family extracellular repeat protein